MVFFQILFFVLTLALILYGIRQTFKWTTEILPLQKDFKNALLTTLVEVPITSLSASILVLLMLGSVQYAYQTNQLISATINVVFAVFGGIGFLGIVESAFDAFERKEGSRNDG